jgi:Uncharacterized protein conserved in bacteria (DUF2066)
MLHPVFRTIAGAAIILLFALSAGVADDNFTVTGVHEDVTAASALAARDQALAQGQEQAFDMLMARLAPGTAPPHLPGDQLTDLIASFEVANEKSSSVRYSVDYTFHFNPDAVRQLLKQSGTSYVTPARPVVVLPVFEAGGRTVLWDDPNPWRDAWANHSGTVGPLSAVVPVGDLTDVSLIDAPKALAGDRKAIAAMSARHQNDDVVVALAEQQDNPTRFNITTTRYAANNVGSPQTMNLVVTQHPNESPADFLTRAVGYTMLRLGQSWQSANVVTSNQVNTLDVHVPVTSLGDWVAIRKRLSQVGLVRSVGLVSFGVSGIDAAIGYVGDEQQLADAVAAVGLDLAGSDPNWTLTVRAAATSAPEPMDSGDTAPSGDGTTNGGGSADANGQP